MWPTTVSHRIDVSSPLYGFSPEQLADSKMEVIDSIEPSIFAGLIHQYLHPSCYSSKVIVNVVGEHGSGASIDSRTSYIGNEIVWGARSLP